MKKILLITSIILTLSIIVIVTFNNMDTKENNIISNVEKNKQVITNNMITMMYETEAGSGEYTETTDNTWPETGYIFNDVLSGCENGGELEYNSQNNTVNLLSNSSDRCYVYFDKYDGVWINDVSVTNVTGSSVTLSVDATSENGSSPTYHYAINDSEEYQESTSNTITINDLNKLTEYNIKIYTIDNTGAKSNIYEINVSTTDISKPVINSVSVSNVTTSGFTLTVNATSDIGIERYYYIIKGENISGTSTINNYTFNNLSLGKKYTISIRIEDLNGTLSDDYLFTTSTQSTLLLADYIKKLYVNQGINGLYYHISSLTNSARDNSYRYAGASVDVSNYICFGSTSTTCPNSSLYRIIGVFGDEVKLVKSTSYGKYSWNSSGNNTWSSSSLNTLLNGTFLNNLGSTWSELITTHSWKVGGLNQSYLTTPRSIYNYEVGSNSSSTTYSSKVALYYVSDYAYAANKNYWNTRLSNYDIATNVNWMFLGADEWTLSRISNQTEFAYFIGETGENGSIMGQTDYGLSYRNPVNLSFDIRPVFYLNSDVQYVSGSGTSTDPIRIK